VADFAKIKVGGRISPFVWAGSIDEELLAECQSVESPDASLNLILVDKVFEADEGHHLFFDRRSMRLLARGKAVDTLVVLSSSGHLDGHDKAEPASKHSRVTQKGKTVSGRSGDLAFIQACRDEKLPDNILRLGEEFLSEVRKFSNDELVEGLSRKWVTTPKNFLALTIQNRKKQFCIHVKKTQNLRFLSELIDVRDDRPGYARFWLKSENQLEAAVSAAKASFETY